MDAPTFSVIITRIVEEDIFTKTFYLARPDGEDISYHAGQFLTFIFSLGGHKVRRSYSLSSSPHADSEASVTVRRIENGLVSRYWVEQIRVGDVLQVLPAAGRFVMERPVDDEPYDMILIGAGSGITPLYALLKEALLTVSQAKILLIYASRNAAETLFSRNLEVLKEQYAHRFQLVEVQSQPFDDWEGMRGRLNNGRIQMLVEKYMGYGLDRAKVFICGPYAFMRTADITLRFMGIHQHQIRMEHFVVARVAVSKPATITQTIQMRVQGKLQPILVRAGQTILEAGLLAGLPLPYSCRVGSCGICAARCKNGRVHMVSNEVLTDRDLQDGWVLTCTGYPIGGPVNLDFL